LETPNETVRLVETPSITNLKALPELAEKPVFPKIIEQTDPSYNAKNTTSEESFAITHSVVYHEIAAWAQYTDSKAHNFYPKRVEAKYKNLSPTSTWEDTRHILKLTNYEQYIIWISQCPRIPETMSITLDSNASIIKYENIQATKPSDINRQYAMAASQYTQMQAMVHQFEQQTKHMKNRMDEIQSQFMYWDQFMESTTKKSTSNLQDQVSQFTIQLKEQGTQILEKAYEDTSNLITQKTQELSNTLDDMAHGFYDGMEHFISEKYKTVKQQLDSVIQGSNTAAKAPSDRPAPYALRPNPRFPNAKPFSSPIKSNSNAFEFPNQMKQNELSSSEDEWSRFGPNKPEDAIEDFRPLPQLQAHKLVHHVKIPYPVRN